MPDGDALLSSLPLALAEIRLQHLMVLRLEIVTSISIGTVVISGGQFASRHDGLEGHVLRNGSHAHGRFHNRRLTIDGRIVLMTDCDEAIAIRVVGRQSYSASAPEASGLRLAMTFETNAARFSWLNGTIAVAAGTARPDHQLYNVLQLL